MGDRPAFRGYRAGALAVLAGGVLLAAAACGGDSGGGEQAGVIAALSYLESSGFHEIDESLTRDGKVPVTARSTALHIQAVTQATAWPTSLKTQARTTARAMADFAAAIDTDTPDIKKATELSNAAHKQWHDLSSAAWNYVDVKAGMKPSGAEHGHQ